MMDIARVKRTITQNGTVLRQKKEAGKIICNEKIRSIRVKENTERRGTRS
jgi:hypothetical protein